MIQAFTSIKLEKDVPIPLYYQLKKQLLVLIDGAVLKDGDMLPPENELSELLGVSRPTVRQAFGELVKEGYLRRYKGKGTYVSRPKVEERCLSKLESFNQEMLQKGMAPHTQVLGLSRIPGDPKANEKLNLPMDTPLIQLSRLRFADDVPLVYVETYLPYKPYAKLLEVDFISTSLYDALEEIYQERVGRVVREIEAVNARRREAELLQISQPQAVFLVRTQAYAADLVSPVEYSVACYRGDLNKFSVEIQR